MRLKQKNAHHGMRKHRLYNTWLNIIHRTNNPRYVAYKNYGGRGISTCERWMDIKNFIEDMYPSFKEGLTLDRIDNDGNYELSNCRWATQTIQSRNTRILGVNNTSGYRGVSFSKRHKKWRSQIKVNYKCISIGIYIDPLDAAIAYDRYVFDNKLNHTINGLYP